MKKVLPILLILAVAVGVFFFMSKDKAGAFSLEMKFKPGQVDQYKMDMNMTMSMPGTPQASTSVSMNMTTTMKMEVVSVQPDGSAKIKYSTGEMKLSSPSNPGMQMPTTPGFEFSATVSKDGKILSVEGMDKIPGMAMSGMDVKSMANQIAGFQLPQKLVAVGDTWQGEMNLPMGGLMSVNYTLAADDKPVGSEKASEITSKFSYSGNLEDWAKKAGKGAAAGIPAGMKGKMEMEGTGTTLFNRAEGKLVSTDADIKMSMDIEVPAAMAGPSGQTQQHMDMTMKMHMEKTK